MDILWDYTMIFILLDDNLQELKASLKCIRLGTRLSITVSWIIVTNITFG